MTNNIQLFTNLSWEQYLNYDDSSAFGPKADGRVFYIYDKNIFVHCKSTSTNKVIDIIYSGGVGYTTAFQTELSNISGKLSPGLFCTQDNEDNLYFKLYYFRGSGSQPQWQFVKDLGGGGVTEEWVYAQLEGYAKLRSEHIEFDLGNPDYNDNSDIGNIHIQGYYEGKVDGGGW